MEAMLVEAVGLGTALLIVPDLPGPSPYIYIPSH